MSVQTALADTSSAILAPTAPRTRASSAMREQIEAFLFEEARLLDTERYREWLDRLVDPAIEYRVSTRQLRMRKDKRVTGPATTHIYDDNHYSLDLRIRQFESGMQWRSDPPERLRHLVSNIEAFHGANAGEYVVYSNCLVVRNRRIYEESTFVYGREDVLRADAGAQLRLLRRTVDYDQRFIEGRNLLFFL